MDASKRPSGLGRGLSALMDEIAPAAARSAAADAGAELTTGPGFRIVPIGRISPNPKQPRRRFDPEALAELVASVRERGILQPILVRALPRDGGFEIIAGERRWRAAQAAQLHEVPVVLLERDDRGAFEASVIENVQRADLNPIEESDSYQRLTGEFGHTQEALSRIVGKSRSHVANMLRLAQLASEAREHVREGRLSLGHAKVLLGAPTERQVEFAARIVEGQLSVRQAEALVADKPAGKSRAQPTAVVSDDPDLAALEATLADAVGLPVTIEADGKGGAVCFAYSSLDQLDALIARLTG